MLADRVRQQDVQLELALDDREGILDGQAVALDPAPVALGEIEGEFPAVLEDDVLAAPQADVGPEAAIELVLRLVGVDVDVGRHHGEMQEPQAGLGVLDEGRRGVALHVVRQVFGRDDPFVVEEVRGVRRIDVLLGRGQDIGQEDGVARRRGQVVVVFPRDAGDGQLGQGRVEVPDLLVEGLVVEGIAEVPLVPDEAGRPVRDRVVELVLADAPSLIEQEDELRREVLARVAVIAPGLAGDDAERRFEALDARRLAQDHVDAPHVRPPARARGHAPQGLVGVLEALEDLFPVLVLGRPRRRVPLFPERLDEQVPVPVVGELQEHVPLDGLDVVSDEFEPAPVDLRQVLLRDLLPGKDERREKQDERQAGRYPHGRGVGTAISSSGNRESPGPGPPSGNRRRS